MALDERRLAFIGAGHITNIILDNLVKAEKLRTHRVIASDPEKNKLQRLYDKYEIIMAQDNIEAVDKGDLETTSEKQARCYPGRRHTDKCL
jgi:pyrroline-5-carboxylate reductase